MHIPDSVLSPTTSLAAIAVMTPVWTLAGRRVRADLGTRQVPLLALGSAFCFTVMLFNIPALGGTTAHPVAATLLAVLLGPWAAVIGVSVALAIQALFFGDGGLLAYGANCFTMAFVGPFVGYTVYQALVGSRPQKATTRSICAAVGAYLGLNAAAAMVALLLGIQPVLFHEPNGHALYFPFGLNITLPAMLGAHLLVAGPAEAVVTALVVRYLQAAGIRLYGVPDADDISTRTVRRETLWIGLLALLALSPLGLLAKGDAWGEWDAQGLAAQIKRITKTEYVPKGVAQSEAHGYKGLGGLADYASDHGSFAYIGAGVLGASLIAALFLVGGRLLVRNSRPPAPPILGGEAPPHPPILGEEMHLSPALPLARGEEHPSPALPLLRGGGNAGETDAVRLPDWLCQPSPVTESAPTSRKRASNPFVERTLAEISSGASGALLGERWAKQPGFLQHLDARAKALGFFGLILAVAFLHNFASLLALCALTVVLAAASRLSIGSFLRRVWLSVPIFVGAFTLPLALNVVTPGTPFLVFWHQPYLALTVPGLATALLLMLRVGVAVSLATLLTLTTRWNDLLQALRLLFVPRLFLSILAMTYRYATVLLQNAAEMFVARQSRTVGQMSNREGRLFVGHSIGALFGKTLALSEEVHAAMVSRGFQGEMHTLSPLRWRFRDSLWTVAVVLIALTALGGEHAFYR